MVTMRPVIEEMAAFLAARLDEEEAAALDGLPDPADRHSGEWTAYGHQPGPQDRRQDRKVQMVGAEPDEGERGWLVCQTGQHDRAAMIAAHIARHDPARALREVAFKRAVLEWHYPGLPPEGAPEGLKICAGEEGDGDTWQMAAPWPCPQIRALAAIWSDHPDYREEWGP